MKAVSGVRDWLSRWRGTPLEWVVQTKQRALGHKSRCKGPVTRSRLACLGMARKAVCLVKGETGAESAWPGGRAGSYRVLHIPLRALCWEQCKIIWKIMKSRALTGSASHCELTLVLSGAQTAGGGGEAGRQTGKWLRAQEQKMGAWTHDFLHGTEQKKGFLIKILKKS